jgi:hypothetical protein
MLFELLVLSGAQVGSDWTSILKKRQDFRWVILKKKYTEFFLSHCFSELAEANVSSSAGMHFQDSMQKLWPTLLKNK